MHPLEQPPPAPGRADRPPPPDRTAREDHALRSVIAASLSGEERLVVTLVYLERLSIRETALVLGLTVARVEAVRAGAADLCRALLRVPPPHA